MRRTFVVALLPALLAPGPTSAQAVAGRVTDDATGEPVAGIPVLLLDASFRTVVRTRTAPDGHYLLHPGGPGSYFVTVDRAGWAAPLSDPVRLDGAEYFDHPIRIRRVALAEAGGPVEPVLQVRPEDVAATCGPRFDRRHHGIVVGQVVDPRSGMTLTNVWVTAHRAGAAPPRRWEARSGVDGLYLFCDLPAGARVDLHAAGGGRVGMATELAVVPGAVHRLDLDLGTTEPGDRGEVLGRVTDEATGDGLDGAEVRVPGTGVWTLTDARGHFALDSLAAGLHLVEVRRIGYGTREIAFRVHAGGAHGLRVPLASEAVALAPITVTVRSRRWARDMRGLQERMLRAAGVFFVREDLDRRHAARVVDLLREVPGLRVRTAARDATLIDVRGRPCTPRVVVDRVHRRDARSLVDLRADELEAVEIYRGPAESSGLFGLEGACGSILLWTRSG